MGIPQGDPITPPTTADVRDTEASPMKAQGVDNTTSLSPGCQPKDETPPAEPSTSPAKADAETPPGEDTTVLLAKADTETPKDLPTDWATSPAKVET